jgi:lysyl-tRNA synthetase class II
MSLRGHGKIMFADLHDQSGKIQLFFQQKTLADKMSETKLLDLGDIVSVSGTRDWAGSDTKLPSMNCGVSENRLMISAATDPR